MSDFFLTQEQYEKSQGELRILKEVKRKEIVERIKEAKSFGDLSENSEYDSAREEQAFVEAKIKQLENILLNVQIIDENVDTDVISLGNTVVYTNMETKQEHRYRIVGVGANPQDEKTPSISSDTPIARKLLGCVVGDEVIVEIPVGKIKLKIKEIQ